MISLSLEKINMYHAVSGTLSITAAHKCILIEKILIAILICNSIKLASSNFIFIGVVRVSLILNIEQ